MDPELSDKGVRLMQLGEIKVESCKAYRVTTQWNPTHTPQPDRVQRPIQSTRRNQAWVADATHIHTHQGTLHLAIVMDVFSRRIVGYQMAARQSAKWI